MKLVPLPAAVVMMEVAPHAGAWIETATSFEQAIKATRKNNLTYIKYHAK